MMPVGTMPQTCGFGQPHDSEPSTGPVAIEIRAGYIASLGLPLAGKGKTFDQTPKVSTRRDNLRYR
jgi:hypothetical protein